MGLVSVQVFSTSIHYSLVLIHELCAVKANHSVRYSFMSLDAN